MNALKANARFRESKAYIEHCFGRSSNNEFVKYIFRLLNTNATVAPAAGDNVSDSGESHAYYSRVAKDFSLEPPPLKEHLYQNFDQVFLAMEDQRQQQKKHPDLLESTPNADDEQFYENTRSLSPSKEVVVNDEKCVSRSYISNIYL